MKKIETVISRDLSLIDIHAWHQGYGFGMKKWLGWSYSDSVFYVHDGKTEIMRTKEEHAVDFKKYVTEKLKEKDWLRKEAKEFDNLVLEIDDFYATSKRILEGEVKNASIAEIYKNYVDYIRKAMGPFVVMYWIPNWFEGDDKYKNETEIALSYRKKTENLFPGGAKLTDLILKHVQSEIKIELEFLRVLSSDELVNYLESGIHADLKKLSQRAKGFIYYNKGIIEVSEETADLGKIFSGLGYFLEEKSDIFIQEFKGQVAYAGIAKGKVRIIVNKKTISSLGDGEVLVSTMTTPEYLPAMKKAVAIITDEGGVTCHAAIVARELKKPCIIGTKIATKVLKDGDLVEVDAERGVVTILSKTRAKS